MRNALMVILSLLVVGSFVGSAYDCWSQDFAYIYASGLIILLIVVARFVS